MAEAVERGQHGRAVLKPLRHNGQEYSGINVLMLWGAAMEAGYCSPFWMTFKQAKELGAHVRKGERGAPVVYAGTLNKTEEQENGNEEERVIPFMKAYTVFNVEQIEGLARSLLRKPEPVIDPAQRIDHAEAFFAASGADFGMAAIEPFTAAAAITCRCPSSSVSVALKPTMRPWRMS
jgi:antirestriction protein ArdC